jgi:hypothetical protein
MNLTETQKDQLQSKGISTDKLEEQLDRFKNGFPTLRLIRAAVIDDGIISLKNIDSESLNDFYDLEKEQLDIIKFVPASGAATRMFKFIYEFLQNYDPSKESVNSFINKNKATQLFTFFAAMEKFPFFHGIKASLIEKYTDWSSKNDGEKKLLFVREMMQKDGRNYSGMPKGLVPFHRYNKHVATAFEEHLFEASIYASCLGTSTLHFTIAPAFKGHFSEELKRIEKIVERKTGVKFNVSYSFQQPHTDTVAVDNDNNPVVLEDGTLFFRPAGHGALLDNLNQLDADLIFIKNIDNVTVSAMEKEVCKYKKTLAGHLIKSRQQINDYMELIEKQTVPKELQIKIEDFLKSELCTVFPKDYHKYATSYQLEFLQDRLNRPLRVCGMVKNEGETGGGPYWVESKSGELSIEIVESVQVDKNSNSQQAIARSGTHFNPVDLVCCVRDYKGNKFDLNDFSDPDTGFITHKSLDGKEIKAQELPGLWNGGMSGWNSIFIEVPLITFNPVKTVNDLLKPAHQLHEHRSDS